MHPHGPGRSGSGLAVVLAQTLFLAALLALAAGGLVAGIAGNARSSAAAGAAAQLAPATEAALDAYAREVAATIAAQVAALPAAAAIPALNGATAFPERTYVEAGAGTTAVSVDVTPEAPTSPACMPAQPNAGPDIAVDAQCAPQLQESRLALAVRADGGVAASDGGIAATAHAATTVTLRLFAQPPYVALTGRRDAAEGPGPHEVDLGGYGNAVSAFGAAEPPDGDTTLHVVYACTPALGDCTRSAPPAPDDPRSLPWTNADGAPG